MHPRSYLRAVAKSWWNVVTFVGGVLAIANGIGRLEAPRWLWLGLLIAGLVLAQLQVALRGTQAPLETPEPGLGTLKTNDKSGPGLATWRRGDSASVLELDPPLAATTVRVEESPAHLQVRLDPLMLASEVYPYSYAAVVAPSEKALPVRVALAARMPTEDEVGVGSAEHEAFENAVTNSLLERWIVAETTVRGHVPYEHSWRPVDPTTSWVITLKRPPARLQFQDEWTVDAQAQLSLRPTVGGGAGWMTMILDSVIRPAREELSGSRPLSFQEFFELIYVMVSSLLDEIGPAIAKPLAGVFELLAVSVVAIPTGGMFNDFVPFDGINGERADGSRDVPGAQWSPKSRAEIDDPMARAASIRAWITRILRDSGFIRGYERDVELLEVPSLAPPVLD